jgi:hypothetical protein
MKETPEQWEGRNKAQFLKSIKDALGREMWFAVKINVIGTFLFAVGLFAGLTYLVNWAIGLMLSTLLVFGVSLYWAWYIRRGENRKWEKQLAANVFANKRAETEINRPPDDLLSKSRVHGQIEQGPTDGPRRSFGG